MTTKIPAELSSTPGIIDSSNATAITIDSSENVGIGETTPLGKVHIKSGDTGASSVSSDKSDLVIENNSHAGITTLSTDSTESGMFFGHASDTRAGEIHTRYDTTTMTIGTRMSGGLIKFLSDNGTERMRIISDGKVGIGTTSPDVLLDVRGEVSIAYNASHGLRFYNSGRSNWSSIGNRETSTGADLQFKTGSATALTLSNIGDFTHMGTAAFTTGTTALRKRTLSSKDFAELSMGGEYATNDTLVVYDTTNSVTRFKVNYQGTVYATSTTISSLSDERLKENITDLDKGLADILKLKPRRFDWKAEEGSGKTGVTGFIAQECEEAGFEEFVDTVDFSETIKNVKTFGYGGLIPALVKAIQEQQDIIEDLKSRIETLEG